MFRATRSLFRLLKICITLTYYGVFSPALKSRNLPIIAKIWIYLCLGHKNRGGVSVALYKLGPTAIKIGQFLATRGDILNEDLCRDLATLQDKVPPFPKEQAIQTIQEDFKKPLEEIFSDFSEPIAAASVAQVHTAILKETGKKIAIKILRPDIHASFARDIYAFKIGASFLHFFCKKVRRLKLPAIVSVFEEWILYELDLRMEASSMSEYQEQIAKRDDIIIPQIYWEYITQNILVMEYIEGTPLTDKKAIQNSSMDTKGIAKKIMQLFLFNATEHGFFHGDMHQGNILITPDHKIALLDFGVMGRLSDEAKSYLARILYGFVIRDYHAIARLHFEAGYTPKDQDVYRFSQSLRAIGEPLFDKSSGEVSMGNVLSALFTVTERFKMETRPELVLLQKNMVSVEGVCSTLDPKANIWILARPILEAWIRKHFSAKKKIENFTTKLLEKLEKAIE